MPTFFDNPSSCVDDKTNTRGSGFTFTNQHRSDHHPHFLHSSKSPRTDYFDQPNKSMPLRSDSLLSLSAADSNNNNMLSFSSASSDKDSNQTSLFSFYQPSLSYIKNTGYGYGGPVSRYKGPFTPSQWMELEHQALIYKHFVANVPVPSNLLNPIRKSLNSFLFPGSSSSYSLGSYGWGTFHLGFAGPTDPEPGRCRRTDGKKWRCSRDAVPDQKYCERHINRGRHRSRKPVESQNGQAVTGPTNSKVGPLVSTSSAPVSHPIASTPINRTKEPQVYSTNYGSLLDHGASNPNPLSNFVEPLKPDWTQLSMSIPIAASEFSSSSNSPAREKHVGLGGLTTDFDHDLDLDPTQKHASNWIPISWGNSSSMGGPLGEVLNQSSGVETSEMWDAVGYHMGSGSSPTGVLQKSSFVSLSNSSSGSSPKRDEHDGGGDQMFLSTLASITSL